MPFMPTVDCVEETDRKTRSALTGHLLAVDEPRTPNRIFTGFQWKPDPFRPDWRCGQQQQQQRGRRGMTEGDEDAVCDLNRNAHSSSPLSLSVNGDQNENSKGEQSATPSLPRWTNEMTIRNAETNGDLTTRTAAEEFLSGRTQMDLVTLLRQLARVTQHAGTIFQRVSTDINRINQRTELLKSRLQLTREHVEPMLGRKAAKPSSSVGLCRYTNVKNHFRSCAKDEYKERRCRLFAPFTRPPSIAALYAEADQDPSKKRLSSCPALGEHCGTQTDEDELRASGTNDNGLFGEPKDDKNLLSKNIFNHGSTSNSIRQDGAGRTNGEIGKQRSSGHKYTLDIHHHINSNSYSVTTPSGPVSSDTAPRSAVIAIDTSRPTVRRCPRSSGNMKNGTDGNKGRSIRRNTVAGVELEEHTRMKNDETGEYDISERIVSTTGDSLANDVVYEFAPFHRRKARYLLNTTGNFFSSLRRSKKEKRDLSSPMAQSTPSKSIDGKDSNLSPMKMSTSLNSDSTAMTPYRTESSMMDNSGMDQKNNGGSALSNIKQLFRRSASLRRSKREKMALSTTDEMGNNSLNCEQNGNCKLGVDGGIEDGNITQSPCGFQRNYTWKPKTNIPISTTSQVIHLATQIREFKPCNNAGAEYDQRFSKVSSSSSRDSAYSSCKKLRPPSVGSLVSLDLAESKLNGWYRQGYQLEYPEECVREEGGQHGQPHSQVDTISHASPADVIPDGNGNCKLKSRTSVCRSASRDTSNSSPYSDVSSFVDSTFSCDRDGYFTSMHRDCGLRQSVGKRATQISSNSSISTVTGSAPLPPNQIRSCGPRAIEKYRPPNLPLSAVIPASPVFPSPAPLSAASEAEITFDLWLMSKFYAEQRMQRFEQHLQRRVHEKGVTVDDCNDHGSMGGQLRARGFERFSLPRCRREENSQKMKRSIVAKYLQSLGYNGEKEPNQQQPVLPSSPHSISTPSTGADVSCTMPRKTVRFCE